MKKFHVAGLSIFFLFLGVTHSFCERIETPSKVVGVAVYPGAALVTRSATVALSPGEHEVVFANIVPDFDESSLRVTGAGTAKVKILGAQMKKEFLKEEASQRARALSQEIEKLQDERRGLADAHNIAMQEREFLNSLRFFSQQQLPEDMVTKIPATKDISELLAFLDTSLKQSYALTMEIEVKAREMDKKIAALQKELAEISNPTQMRRSVVVDVQATSGGNLNLDVSYLVGGASWRPVYDARAAFDKSEVEFVTYGVVRQMTGEDWTDVDMALLTSRPSLGGRLPYVAPWILEVYQLEPRKFLQSRMKESADAIGEQYAPGAALMTAETGIGGPEEEPAEQVYTTAEEKGTGVAYRLSRKATVKSDGTEYRLPVGAQTFASKFNYTTYPRASAYAYLRSTVFNSDQAQLPAGRVNIFLDNDFVGKSNIDNVGPGEKFDVYLGVDENVKVKREQIEKKVDDVLIGGIPAPTIKTTVTNKVTMENYKNKDIAIDYFEAMPVSQDERIRAKVVSAKPEPTEKDWESRKGVWRWALTLKPKEKREVVYTYVIEHARDIKVPGL